jgi:hypothetical protein
VGLNGPSRIWDAVDDVISALEKEPGRRAVILVTDGYQPAIGWAWQMSPTRASAGGLS